MVPVGNFAGSKRWPERDSLVAAEPTESPSDGFDGVEFGEHPRKTRAVVMLKSILGGRMVVSKLWGGAERLTWVSTSYLFILAELHKEQYVCSQASAIARPFGGIAELLL